MSEKIFIETPRFCQAVKLINDLDKNRFPKLLARIAEKLHLKHEKAFTEDEQTKLQTALDVSLGDITLLLDTIEFILQQAAYYSMKAQVLHQQLLEVNIAGDKAETIVKAWMAYGKEAVEKMKQSTFSLKQLESVDWGMSLQLAQSSKTQMKETNAIFHFNLSNHQADCKEKILLELSHAELVEFYNKLENIQNQLDSLS